VNVTRRPVAVSAAATVLATALVAGLVTIAIQSAAVRRQLSLSFTKRDAAATQLFFTRPDQIVAAESGVFPRPLSFTIVNGAAQPATFAYAAVLRSGQRVIETYTSSLRVGGRQAAAGTIPIAEPQGVPSYTLSVSLAGSDRTIFFRGAVR
jgi:hypothetical protein